MDIVIDIKGFRDVNGEFIPKEVAVVAINAPIVGHWIMMPPQPFGELPERSNNEIEKNTWTKVKQAIGKEEEYNLAKLDSSTLADRNKRETVTIFSQTDIENPVIQNTGNVENTSAKETCGGLSCRQSPEGVDTIDSNCR
ncbi:hypothetical protein RF55_21923 [Lasius niger]|uniref:Uncharacterized protein n=1 Tax=Lasius niger TaxID=67767 RepID=A0A0J7JXI7_LASNI|nr:hypothetical protein RF55_21923 [Lasius niger]